MFVCMDSMAKYLGTFMPITQAIWGRFFFHLISLIIFFLIFKPKVNLKKNFKVQIIRSTLMVTATSFMFYSLQKFRVTDERRWNAKGQLVTESEATVNVFVNNGNQLK